MNDMKREMTEEQLLELLNGIDDDIKVPLDVSAAWRNAVRKEEKKRKLVTFSKRISAAAAAIVVLLGMTAIMRNQGVFMKNGVMDSVEAEDRSVRLYYTAAGSEVKDENAYLVVASDSSMEEEIPVTEETLMDAGEYGMSNDESVIYTYAASVIESGNAQKTAKEVTTEVNKAGGYIASEQMRSDKGGKTVVLNACIPEEKLSEFGNTIMSNFPGSSFEINRQDATRLYTDATKRIESLRLMAERLNSLIETAQAEEIPDLYDQLNRIYDEIDELCVSVDSYGRESIYADTEIVIREANEAGFGEKLKNAFGNLGDGFFTDAVVTACILLPVIAVAVIIVLILRKKH